MGRKWMKFFLMQVIVVAMAFVFCGCEKEFNKAIQAIEKKSSSKSSKSNLSPKATMQHFILRCQASDGEGALKYFSEDLLRQVKAKDESKDMIGFFLSTLFKDSRIVDVEEDYGSATVYVRLEDPISDENAVVPFPMVLEDGEWKISDLDLDLDD